MLDIAISIIVPVYNVEDYLRDCLNSILAQDFKDFELILVDDGSTDSSGYICDQYQKSDNRIRVFHIQNGGQAKARNYGFVYSKGEYICYVDSDDIIHPLLLGSLMRGIKEYDTKISMCSALISESLPNDFFENTETFFLRKDVDEQFFNSLIDSDWETQGIKLDVIWGKLIHRDIIDSFPFAEGRIYEDTAIICRWFNAAITVSDSSGQLYFYRKRKNSTITAHFSTKKLDQLWADEETERFYRKQGYKRMIAFSSLAFCQHAISMEQELKKCSETSLYKAVRRKKRRKVLLNIKSWDISKNDYFYYLGEALPIVKLIMYSFATIKNKIYRK